jgi:predicted Rossmann fold flavoprotein
MDMIFTHFGLSGPAILRCSQFVVQAKKKFEVDEVTISVDACPDENEEQIFQKLISIVKEDGKKSAKNGFRGILPERYLLFLLGEADIDVDQVCNALSQEKLRAFAKLIKRFEIVVNGTLSIEKAFVTGGGVSIKEIDPKTMGSKLVPNLFFCGEILDIHGYTGGYNITAAMVTGRIAGLSAGEVSKTM